MSGALGLVLALALGVEARGQGLSAGDRIKKLLSSTHGLLKLGAIVYGVSAIAGGVVWGVKGDETPDLVTTVVLTVVGYAAASMTAVARTS